MNLRFVVDRNTKIHELQLRRVRYFLLIHLEDLNTNFLIKTTNESLIIGHKNLCEKKWCITRFEALNGFEMQGLLKKSSFECLNDI